MNTVTSDSSIQSDEKMNSFLNFSLDDTMNEKSKMDKIREYTTESRPAQLCLALVVWLGSGTAFYRYHQNLTGAQAFFAVVDAGFSIGFGASGPTERIPEGMNYSAMNETEIAALNISSVYVGCYNQANGGKSAAGCEIYTIFHIIFGTLIISCVLGFYAAYIVYKCDDWKEGIKEMAKKEADKERYSPPDPNAANNRPGKAKAASSVTGTSSSTLWDNTFGSSLFRTVGFFVFLVFIGIIWGMTNDQDYFNLGDDKHWSFGKSALFAVAAMSTGGLVSPNIDDFSMGFVAVLSIIGVISYGMAIGAIADVFSDYELNRLIKQKVKGRADTEEIEFVQKLQATGGCLTRDKFLAIELMKMGKISQDDLDLIDGRWNDMDVDSDGGVSTEEMVAAMYFEMADADNTGTLDKREFEFLLEHMEKQIPSVIRPVDSWGNEFDRVDADNSKCLNRREFILFWRKFRDSTMGTEAGSAAIQAIEGKARRPYSLTAV